MSIVVCKLPKAGLGNQLFPLMNALVFAKLNNLKVIVIGYHQLKLGPYLRNEKSKRRYSGYFNFQKNIVGAYLDTLKIKALRKKYKSVYESQVDKLSPEALDDRIFFFEKMPSYHDYFIQLKPHRELVKQLLYEQLNPWIIKEVAKAAQPVIGVHVRMGDFRKLDEGETFKGGHVRTPEDYFVDIINGIREIHGRLLPVSVFTDGRKNEFKDLFRLEQVNLAEGNADIVDLLLLSKSRIIVSSTGSTFSYWAGFISDAAFIKHPDHIHQPIWPESNQMNKYEGPFDKNNETLVQQIREI